jgi:hypothetical protein
MVTLQPNLYPGTQNSTPTFVHRFFFEPTIDDGYLFLLIVLSDNTITKPREHGHR